MPRNNLIGFFLILFGGVLGYFFLTNTPSPKPTGTWVIFGLFVGVALCSLLFFFGKKKVQ